MNAQPEPGSTPGRETLRNRWRGRRLGDRRHPGQWFLRYEIRAGPRVGEDPLSQIGSAVAAEIAAVADLGPELLRRVASAARLAERHRMVRTQCEEQRSESDEHQHDARIVVLEAQACQAGRRNSSVEGGVSGGYLQPAARSSSSFYVDSSIPVCGDLSTARRNRPKFNGSLRRSRNGSSHGGGLNNQAHGATPTAHPCG